MSGPLYLEATLYGGHGTHVEYNNNNIYLKSNIQCT